ncbi:MAG TPA: hypothetical protein VNR11_11855 [Xanthobacteraceae bacterium]|nr:hypothetical protein [Xanthobacteraceae bacterium]
MFRFSIGLVVGLILGTAATSIAAVVAGNDGYLTDWTITKDGEELCSDPFVWTGTMEIECH